MSQDENSPAPVPLISVQRQNDLLWPEISQALEEVFKSGRFVLGPDVQQLEEATAKYCQAPHAIGCASGSDALLLALMVAEVGPGDEVILPSYTFFATASAVSRLGGTPVFVDIDPVTYNLDVQQVAEHITPNTKAIIPVHLYGQCADMEPLIELCEKHELFLIEDAAQAIGAEYHGKPAGSMGDVGCFSFYPTKNLGGVGDGGMLTCLKDDVADKLNLLRGHGMRPRYIHHLIGINSRLDSLQAAVLNIKLKHLDEYVAKRTENANRYAELFAEAGLSEQVVLPVATEGCRHVWNQYIVRVSASHRDALRNYLGSQHIGSEIYYPVPLHAQPCFQDLGYQEGDLPETDKAAKETLALPIFPELTADEQARVVEAIAAYCRQQEVKPLKKAG